MSRADLQALYVVVVAVVNNADIMGLDGLLLRLFSTTKKLVAK